MWIPSYHRFASRAAFLAACDAAGWPRDPLAPTQPAPPAGVVLVELGPHTARPTVAPDGTPVPGEVLNGHHHVNAAWHGVEIPAGFAAAAIEPATPSHSIGVPPAPAPAPPVVPAVIAAWKAKAWLELQDLLAAAEAAAEAGGVIPRNAWRHATEWHRDSPLMTALATGLGMTAEQIDDAFIAADQIQG